MKRKKKENKNAHFISPVVKKGNANPKVANFDELYENTLVNSDVTEMKILELSTNKKLKVEESKDSIEDVLSEDDSSSSDLSDMSSGRIKDTMY